MSQKMIVKVWDENCALRCKLALDPQDVEEAIARCGFMILNDAENVTDAHRAEITRCERDGAGMTTGTGEEAVAWWNARKIHEIKYSGEPGRVFATVNGETFGPFLSIRAAEAVLTQYKTVVNVSGKPLEIRT